jgi:hypothetical protein
VRNLYFTPPRRYLLIYTNENELEYEESYKGEGGETDLEIPKALKSSALPKAHQRAGVAWLQRNFRLNGMAVSWPMTWV